MSKKVLFIEGTSDRSNGVLRQGFHKLIRQLLAGNMPKIIMGNSKTYRFPKIALPIRTIVLPAAIAIL